MPQEHLGIPANYTASRAVANNVPANGISMPAVSPIPVIQRVTIQDYLADAKHNINENDWDPSYDDDLETIEVVVTQFLRQAKVFRKFVTGTRPEGFLLRTLNLVTNNGSVNPDANPANWKTYIDNLASTNRVSRAEISVLNYCLGLTSSKPGTTSLGSLKFQDGRIEGRPRFHTDAQKGITLRAKEHRRHIIAWHNIREFANEVYKRMPDQIINILTPLLEALKKFNIYDKAKELVAKLGLHDDKEILLLEALYIMNSNAQNLWPGQGKENSGINIASMNIQEEMESWENLNDMVRAVDKWNFSKPQQDTVPKQAKALVFGLVKERLNTPTIFFKALPGKLEELNFQVKDADLKKFYQRWALYKKASFVNKADEALAKEVEILEHIKEIVTKWIISHMEFDLGFDDASTEQAISRDNILEVIPVFYKTIFEGGVLEAGEVKTVFTNLLTLPANIYSEKESK